VFRGSLVALITPMHPDGTVDYTALEALLSFHIEQGTDGIVAVGTTGESATLTYAEHCQVIAFCVDTLKGRLPLIAGTGANSTQEAIELTRCAKEAGADACLLVTPYYNKPTQEGLYLHHKAIAQAVAIPQILYNVPGRTACDMKPETVVRLSAIDNIIGVKEATGDLSRVAPILAGVSSDFMLYSGDDATAVDFILMGGHGGISVTANLAPKTVHQAYAAAVSGDAQRAHALNAPLMGLHQDLFIESNPIPVKWGAWRLGQIQKGIRLPLTWLSKDYEARLEEAMKTAGILV